MFLYEFRYNFGFWFYGCGIRLIALTFENRAFRRNLDMNGRTKWETE